MKPGARWTAFLLLVLTFAVGALSGMAIEEALGIDWFEFLDEDGDDAEDRVLEGLSLTGEQRERVEEILERQEDRLEEYWQGRLPEIRGILERSYAEIRALLTVEQRDVFDQRVRELDGRVPAEVRD